MYIILFQFLILLRVEWLVEKRKLLLPAVWSYNVISAVTQVSTWNDYLSIHVYFKSYFRIGSSS